MKEKFASIDIDTATEIAKRLCEESEFPAIKDRMTKSFADIVRRETQSLTEMVLTNIQLEYYPGNHLEHKDKQ